MTIHAGPFTPGITVSRTVTSSTARVALGATGQAVMIQSIPSGNIAFIKFGDSTVEAVTTDTPVLPGVVMVLVPPATATHMAAIGSATTTLYATSGYGN